LELKFKRIIGDSLSHNIFDVLDRFKMENCNPVSTPEDNSIKLLKGVTVDEKRNGSRPYHRELVGNLMYLAVATRPDIAYRKPDSTIVIPNSTGSCQADFTLP